MIIKGKYVIFDRAGLEYPVLIPNSFVTHREIRPVPTDGGCAGIADTALSAGFFTITPKIMGYLGEADLQICVWGSSTSLNLKSRPELDAQLIRSMFDANNSLI